MDLNRLGKLLEAYRLAAENAGNDDGKERAKWEGEIRALIIGGPDAAPDPWPGAVRSASEAPDMEAAWRVLVYAVGRPLARSINSIHDPLPAPLLSLAGKGALLSTGDVCMLSGEGGIAKSALAVGLAVDVANAADGAESQAGPLRWHGGPASTLLVCYEDHVAHVAWRAQRYAERQACDGLDRVAVLSLEQPMYGPAGSLTGGAALYNARPQPLAGWHDVAAAAAETGARLIVIDPAGEAFAGEHNNVSAVREFLRALRGLAAAHEAGVILIGHSNKAARKKEKNPDLFDSGLVSGSAAWHDGVRGVLSLQWRIGGAAGARDLVCPKSNHGPARMVCGLDAIRDPGGAILGFEAAGVGWHTPARKGETHGGGTMTKTRSGDNTDPVAVGNRAADAWAEADPGAVMIAAASADGQAALMGAANAFTDAGKGDKARAVADVMKLAGVAAHLSALADRVAQQSFGGSAALARTVAKEMRRGLKLAPLSIPAVVELLQTTETGGGVSALAVMHAQLPRPGLANINRTDRILPSRLAMVDPTDRRAGRLFTPAAHAVERGGGQLKLPGFGLERTRITPALPLALYDLGGGSSMERGHGAPLALRLWVESILAVGLTDRANPWPTVLEIPLRDLLRKLYPNKRRPRPNEYWPRLMQAVEILDSTRIPWEDPETGKGGLQRIVNISSIPRGPGKLDDAVRIIVDLPPGSGSGPVVSPHLARYGVQSAPLYRGLLNLAFLWFDPGRTRFPVRGGKHWLQVEDPERYPTITNDLLIELFYPTSSQKARRNLASRAGKSLGRLVKGGEARIVKGRLLPPKPPE